MTAAEPLTNPFPGLRPFEADETHLFFGREGQSGEIVKRLAQRRFVAVVGTSGSGKSSLVRAGLLPALDGGYMASAGSFWRFAVMSPGYDAIRSLAAALADPLVLGGASVDSALRTNLIEAVLRRSGRGLIDCFQHARLEPHENLLVVVDQFEELFRFRRPGAGGDDGTAFVNLLLEAARCSEQPIYVVLTMRSDFLGDCARFPGLPEMLNDGQYLIPRLTRGQRRASIEGPVAVGGARIAPRLTQRLLNDAGDDPDALPVLQHALMRTWDAWKAAGQPDRPIDLEDYEGIGGMARALSLHADQAYASLAAIPGGPEAAQSLFRCLCERGADYRETRRPTAFAELCEVARTDAATMARVIDAFRTQGRTFLRPQWPATLDPGAMIDISHEALIRHWQMLRDWVQREARSAALYQRLRQTALLWPQNAALWRNPDLERALLWEREETPSAAWAVRYGTREDFARAMEFLRASEAAWQEERDRAARAEREAAEAELEKRTQLEREARLRAELGEERSRKRLLQAVVVLVPALLAGLGWALFNRSQVMKERDRAEESRVVALEQRAEAERERERATEQARIAQEAREKAEQLLERLTNSNRLKQAFLRGQGDTIQQLAARSGAHPELRFGASRTPTGKMPDGTPLYQFDLFPLAQTLSGPLRSASQVSYYMNHPTFNPKLLSAGSGSGFRASYTGWGCLTRVYVLIEYADPDTPPQMTQYDQCSAIP